MTLEDSKLEDDPYESGYLVNYFTFRVEECMKGAPGGKLVIKQMANGPYAVPGYDVGKTYLLFLPADSENTGLVAPVGIWQGLVPLEKRGGAWSVVPSAANARLFKELRTEAKALSAQSPASQGEYQNFKTVIKNIVEEGR